MNPGPCLQPPSSPLPSLGGHLLDHPQVACLPGDTRSSYTSSKQRLPSSPPPPASPLPFFPSSSTKDQPPARPRSPPPASPQLGRLILILDPGLTLPFPRSSVTLCPAPNPNIQPGLSTSGVPSPAPQLLGSPAPSPLTHKCNPPNTNTFSQPRRPSWGISVLSQLRDQPHPLLLPPGTEVSGHPCPHLLLTLGTWEDIIPSTFPLKRLP